MSRKHSAEHGSMEENENLKPRKVLVNFLNTLEVNKPYLTLIVFFIGLGPIQNGFALAGTNLISPVLKTKFDWHSKDGEFYIVLLDAAGILGMAIGSMISGSFIQQGRRKTFLQFNFLAVLSIIPQLFEAIGSIFVGRLCFGMTTGVLISCGAKMIDEIVPLKLIGIYGPTTSIFMTFGIFNSIVLGIMLPDSEDTAGQIENENWRVLLGFPLIYQFISLAIFTFFLKEDTITYSINSGKDEDAKKMINRVYKNCNADEVLANFKQNTQDSSSKVTIKEAITGVKYRKATWFCFFNIFFGQMTGSNVMNVISTRLFQTLYQNGKIDIAPNTGSYFIGLFTWLGTLASVFFLNNAGRKPVLLWGNIIMSILLFCSGISIVFDQGLAALIFLMIYMFTFEGTQGPTAWLYTAETVVDQAMGFCTLCMFGTLMVLTLIADFVVDSAIRAEGLIFVFCGFTFLAIFYIHFLCRETRGLTDKQKKQIFNIVIIDEKQPEIELKNENLA